MSDQFLVSRGLGRNKDTAALTDAEFQAAVRAAGVVTFDMLPSVGDLLVGSSDSPVALSAGTEGQVLSIVAGMPQWAPHINPSFNPSSHNALIGIQGGIFSERFHLTAAEYGEATQYAGPTQNGLMTSSQAAQLVDHENRLDQLDGLPARVSAVESSLTSLDAVDAAFSLALEGVSVRVSVNESSIASLEADTIKRTELNGDGELLVGSTAGPFALPPGPPGYVLTMFGGMPAWAAALGPSASALLSSHNLLLGLQGGDAFGRYHLTADEWLEATQYAGLAQNGLMTSSQAIRLIDHEDRLDELSLDLSDLSARVSINESSITSLAAADVAFSLDLSDLSARVSVNESSITSLDADTVKRAELNGAGELLVGSTTGPFALPIGTDGWILTVVGGMPAWFPGAVIINSHNSLSGLQGGDLGEYYHLASDEWVETSLYARDHGRSAVQTVGLVTDTLAAISLPDNKVFLIEARISARRTDGGGQDRAGYIRTALAYRAGGGATLQGTVDSPFTRESTGTYNATIDVNGNDARLRVTGVAGQTIEWRADYSVTEV